MNHSVLQNREEGENWKKPSDGKTQRLLGDGIEDDVINPVRDIEDVTVWSQAIIVYRGNYKFT